MRYRDEKYVEALEEKVKALEAQLRLRGSSRAPTSGWGSLANAYPNSSAVATEEAYRRARVEVAADAGVGYGRVSLEALYLLPAEFTNVYQRLFLRALRESPGRVGEANPPVKTKGPKSKGKEIRIVETYEDDELGGQQRTGKREVTLAGDRDPDRGGGSARARGRRHRDHWTVADERAFRLKRVADDQLRELARWITQAMAAGKEEKGPISGAAGSGGQTGPDQVHSSSSANAGALQCRSCSRFLRSTWNHCPHCGQAVVD